MTRQAKNSNIGHIGLLAAILWSLLILVFLLPAFSQVAPVEIKDSKLRATEQTYLPQLMALNQAISSLKFPFKLSLNRYIEMEPKDQTAADMRGLEYVNFHDRELLKISANYNAAYNVDVLTPNQRAGRVLDEVILPVLRLLPQHFSQDVAFDGFGFEIAYHIRTHNKGYGYEGKENLVVVFDKADGFRYPLLQQDASRQEILNRSEIYLNGEPLGLVLNSKAPLEIEALVHRPSASAKSTSVPPDAGGPKAPQTDKPTSPATTGIQPKAAGAISAPASPALPADLGKLREKYQAPLERLAKDGVAGYHFVEYAPPSFVIIHDQVALQATLRNPESFDKKATSIYKRAARSFDLFLAPQLKSLLSKIPESPDFSLVDFSVVHELTISAEQSSEAIEFILPLKEARQFADSLITNQDLIDKSIVLVNGVRIALNLAQVE